MEKKLSIKTKAIDSVKIPIKFLHDPKLRSLSYFCGEPLPLTLGRVVALGMLITEKRINEFALSELDQVASWKGQHPFARYLEMVGWAKVREITCLVNMPREVQPWHWRRFTGAVRCMNAKRDANGRLLPNTPNDPTKERVISRRHATYDADGNMVVERFYKGAKKGFQKPGNE